MLGRQRDADADADRHMAPFQLVGLAEIVDDALGGAGGLGAVARAAQNEGELVAAKTGDGVDLPGAAAQAVADLAQQFVAAMMPERVVHLLEPVEVEAQQRKPLASSRRASANSANCTRLGRPVIAS